MTNRILVVDDEPDLELLITQRFRKRIRSEELSFVFAGNGEQALDRLKENGGIDVVLTDINMPVMDGLTLLSRLSEAHPLLRSIIVSAYGDMPNIRRALNRGAFDFITKPIDFQDLELTLDKAISEALERKQAAVDRERLLGLGRELELARHIQESLVPHAFPEDDRVSVHGSMKPAAEVGGDLFDCFFLEPGRLAFTIGDVSGKGIGAAIFMAVCRTVLRVAARKGLSPGECLYEAHQFLHGDRRVHSTYVTCFYGIIDLGSGQVEYSRAGHNPPYLVRGNVAEELSSAGGLPLGLMRSVKYGTATKQLEPGDTLVLFTDGITEAMNPHQELYGDERLSELLGQRVASIAVEDVVQLVIDEASEFAGGARQSDDMTVLGIRYLGNG